MCRRVTCSSCGKPTFAGCGAHIDQVLGDVPRDQRCKCREQGKASGDKPTAASTSFFDRLFGK
ncbi:MAG: hypothetical protein IT382_20425 [Deltaproteobacteria bacterium]|nr:hypothetical protein [Deltaproteobacteria bacterium]